MVSHFSSCNFLTWFEDDGTWKEGTKEGRQKGRKEGKKAGRQACLVGCRDTLYSFTEHTINYCNYKLVIDMWYTQEAVHPVNNSCYIYTFMECTNLIMVICVACRQQVIIGTDAFPNISGQVQTLISGKAWLYVLQHLLYVTFYCHSNLKYVIPQWIITII